MKKKSDSKANSLKIKYKTENQSISEVLRESVTTKFQYPVEGVTRKCVLNLIVYSEGSLLASHSEEIVGKVFGNIPLRAIFVNSINDSPGLSTNVASFCRLGSEGKKQFCVEQVFLNTNREALEDLPCTVLPFLVPELTTFLWWRGKTPFEDSSFLDMSEICDVVLLDSADFHSDPKVLFKFNTLVQKRFSHSVFTDLNWIRLKNWREETALSFDNPERLENIKNIKKVKIVYSSSSEKDFFYQPLLFLGWMASLLGWDGIKNTSNDSSTTFSLRSKDGAKIEAEVVRDVIEGAGNNILEVQFEIKGVLCNTYSLISPLYTPKVQHCFSYIDVILPEESEVLFSQLQNIHHDPVFVGALKSSCSILNKTVGHEGFDSGY